MHSLFQYTSNNLRTLARELAQLLSESPDSPLSDVIVVVQSLAMRRWLTLELATINGVCANVEFPFPSDFISSLPQELDVRNGVSKEIPTHELTWAIYRVLPTLLGKTAFNVVRP